MASCAHEWATRNVWAGDNLQAIVLCQRCNMIQKPLDPTDALFIIEGSRAHEALLRGADTKKEPT